MISRNFCTIFESIHVNVRPSGPVVLGKKISKIISLYKHISAIAALPDSQGP
jgi:hypothetical protein